MIEQGVLDDLLVQGIEDWIMLIDIRNAVIGPSGFQNDEGEIDKSLGAINEMLARGYFVVGDPGKMDLSRGRYQFRKRFCAYARIGLDFRGR